MKVAIFGLGSIGRRHARCFREAGAAEIIGMDPVAERREQFVAELEAPAVASEQEALAASPDLVVVASPNTFHVRQAMMAAEAGCALLVEKPLGTDLAGAESLVRAVRERGLYFHMGSNWKFHPAFLKMKQVLQSGAIGQVTGGQVIAGQWLPDWHPWEDYRNMYAARASLGGGAIFDTHEIDYLTWLLGEARELIGLKAHTGLLEIETEDVAACVIRFAGGALVTLLTDYIQRTPKRSYFLSGSEGSLEWDLRSGEIAVWRAGEPAPERSSVHLADANEMYVAQARRVLSDLKSGGRALTDENHALAVLQMQLAWRDEKPFQRDPGVT